MATVVENHSSSRHGLGPLGLDTGAYGLGGSVVACHNTADAQVFGGLSLPYLIGKVHKSGGYRYGCFHKQARITRHSQAYIGPYSCVYNGVQRRQFRGIGKYHLGHTGPIDIATGVHGIGCNFNTEAALDFMTAVHKPPGFKVGIVYLETVGAQNSTHHTFAAAYATADKYHVSC